MSRPVEVLKRERIDPCNMKSPFRSVKSHCGIFLEFGVASDESGPYSVAIVQVEGGGVEIEELHLIKFLD